jgi:hypothetical protein
LGIENRKLKYFLPSFPASDNNREKKNLFFFGPDGGRTGCQTGARRGGQTGLAGRGA